MKDNGVMKTEAQKSSEHDNGDMALFMGKNIPQEIISIDKLLVA